MSTLCPYRIIKGDDGLSVKVEWDVHYITDEQIGIMRKYVAEIEAENEKLRELVRDWRDLAVGGADSLTDWNHKQADLEHRMSELGVEV